MAKQSNNQLQYNPGSEIVNRPRSERNDPHDQEGSTKETGNSNDSAAYTRIQRRREEMRAKKEERIRAENTETAKEKLGGFGFKMILGVGFLKDIAEPAFAILSAAALSSGTVAIVGIAAGGVTDSGIIGIIVAAAIKVVEFTGVGTAIINSIDMALSLFVSLAGVFVSLILYFTVLGYLMLRGISFTTRKLVTVASSFIMSILPLFNLLPETVVMLLILRHLDKKEARAEQEEQTKKIKKLSKQKAQKPALA